MEYREDFVEINGYKTWYCVYGKLNGDSVPLIGLHGGPGYPHHHLLPIAELAERGTPVVLYDQLGCGKSDWPDDPNLWTIELFVNELAEVRRALGLDRINLYGHSWGGTLAVEYMLTKPEGVKKLILSSPLLDTQLWVSEAGRLKGLLPDGMGELMLKLEKSGATDSGEYEEAYKVFQKNFVCRIVPQPDEYDQADAEWGKQVYETMWGPSEAFSTGTLKEYSAFGRLREIETPTLLVSGSYDEATPIQLQKAKDEIPNSQWVLLENSSHSGMFEEKSKYLDAIGKFLVAP